MQRRDLLKLGAAMPLLAYGEDGMQRGSDPIVETAYGKIRGARDGSVLIFKGVPYGDTTAGEGRFMPPRPPQAWSGIRDTIAYGASAPQTDVTPPSGPMRIMMGQIARAAAAAPAASPPPRLPESEDCLVLNIWTSGLSDGRKRPVMVRLHGGFFMAGSGSGIDGRALTSRGDVVVVSINHRLNVFGFSHLADLPGSEFADAGNVGMLDVIAALKWIRDHIERFGGDPARVMIFGESGGGMKTSFLLGSPPAQGLFHTAGIESGPALKFMERPAATHAVELLLREVGLTTNQLNDLQRLPQERLLAAFFAVNARLPPVNFVEMYGFCPVLDPKLLPNHPFSPMATTLSTQVPLLIGWNRSDMTFFMGDDPQGFALDDAGLQQRLTPMFGAKANEVIAAYRQAMPKATATDIYISAWTDRSVSTPIVQQAERKAAQRQAAVYLYRFDWGSPALGGKLGATHTLEIPFVFNNVQNALPMTGGGADAQLLAGRMSEAWVSFAAKGDPNSSNSGLPHWPAFDGRERKLLAFDSHSHVDSYLDPKRRALLQEVAPA